MPRDRDTRPPTLLAPRWRNIGVSLSEARPIHVGLVRAQQTTAPDYDMHYGLEFGVVLSGRLRRYWPSYEAEVASGQAWFCGMWEPHGWSVMEAPCEHLVLVTLPQLVVDPLPGEGSHRHWLAPFTVPPEQRPQVEGERRTRALTVAREFAECNAAWADASPLWRRLLSFELLLTLLEGWELPPVSVASKPYLYDVLRAALEVLFQSRCFLTAEEVGRACGASRSSLGRAFTQFMGMPFAQFALQYRLSQVATQLLRTESKIVALAGEWGFTDESHLHRCFARYYGCSPGEYRRRHASDVAFGRPRAGPARGRATWAATGRPTLAHGGTARA